MSEKLAKKCADIAKRKLNVAAYSDVANVDVVYTDLVGKCLDLAKNGATSLSARFNNWSEDKVRVLCGQLRREDFEIKDYSTKDSISQISIYWSNL
jgi:hypothetical protein